MTNSRRLSRWSRRGPAILLALALVVPMSARALRLVDYNILNYPGSTGTARAPYYRTILGPLGADVIVTEEMSGTSGGPDQFLNEVLNVLEPGQWATVPFVDGNDTDSSIFYRTSKVDFVGQSAFYPNPANPLRLVHVYRLALDGYDYPATQLRIYACHLKASTGFESQRYQECVGIRDSLNAMPPGTYAMLCGDLNFYKQSTETGYAKLLENQSNNTGRLIDLLPAGEWHDNGTYALYHTQSPCKSGTCASGAATGGMDDRFDFILPTYNLVTNQKLSIIPNTCTTVGNDGLHLNLNITDAPTIPEGAAYATALQLASDHLPLRVDLRVPAMLDLPADLAFDPVIVGAPTQAHSLLVGNLAAPPADSLNCAFSAPSGFGAPPTLAVPAASWSAATITMSASTPGLKSGLLTALTDAPDDPTRGVALTGSVLDHASPSLDSLGVLLASNIDFGDHEAGSFAAQSVRVHNQGYNVLQARLSLDGATITGGGGHFALAETFEPALVGTTGRSFGLVFDDAGTEADSTYTATLVFASADEPLPGATARPSLTVQLRAKVLGGAGSTPAVEGPLVTRLHPARPNPVQDQTTLQLDLATAGSARVGIFDASGRRIATLWDGPLAAGRHSLRWTGSDLRGTPVGSGVYFVRVTTSDGAAQVERLIIVR